LCGVGFSLTFSDSSIGPLAGQHTVHARLQNVT
jgi:hypothetical protein